MRSPLKFIIVLVFIGLSSVAFGRNCDTAKLYDTILLPPDKIQSVEIACNSIPGPLKPEVINSQAEFNKFISKDCHTIPAIDFSTQTLLYYPTKASGCKADYVRTIKIAGSSVVYNVNIILQDGCTVLQYNSNCIAIPKLDTKCSVHFQKSETNKKDTK